MKLRNPNPGDWSQVLELAGTMHEESWFKDFDFDPDKVREIFDHVCRAPDWLGIVAEDAKGNLAGFFAAAIVEHFFGRDRYACDIVNYLLPVYRGGLTATRFVRVYETWALSKGVKEIHLGVSTATKEATRIQKFYERLGYHSPAVGLRKKCVESSAPSA